MKFSSEGAVAFVRASVFLVCSWPPSTKSSRLTALRFRAQWWFVFVTLMLLFAPLLNGVWVFRNDPIIAVKAVLMASAGAQALMKILVCRHYRKLLQSVHEEMDTFLEKAEPFERRVIDSYVKKYCGAYGFVTVCVWLVCIGFVVDPLITSQPFPTDSSFPFDVSGHPIYELIYFHQSIAIFHIAAALSIDSQVALLFWYTGARFQMLGLEFQKSKCEHDINRCVLKHQSLLVYAKKVTDATSLIALATAATTTIGIICGGLTLLTNQPPSIKLRVGNMVFNASIELFVYAWPADNLTEMSGKIGNRAYKSKWLGKSVSMQKNVLTVIHRCQKPVTISVGGFLPKLSLYYYASFLSSSYSYFSTIRLMYSNKE